MTRIHATVAHATKLRLAAIFTLILGFVVLPVLLHAATAPAVVGNWEGSISAGGQSLRIQFHFTQTKEGALVGTLVSPDQSADAIAIDKIEFKDPALHFEIAAIGGSYDGTYDKAKDEISGQWKQGGQSLALTVKRAK
jgi:uncharacterized protein